MPLIGDARRRRVLERMKFTREREMLESRIRGIGLAIQKARRNPDQIGRVMSVAQLRDELNVVLSDLSAAATREHSAKRDLGEA